MAKELLTERRCKAATVPPGATETALHDGGNGLVLRVRKSRAGAADVKAWQLYHHAGGQRAKISLGGYPTLSLGEARRKAEEHRSLLAAGIALPPARNGQRRNVLAAPGPLRPSTVGELMDRWESDYLRGNHKDKGAAARAAYRRHVEPYIGALALLHWKKVHVQHIMRQLTAGGPTRTAASILALMRQMAQWGIRQDFLAADPTFALRKADYAPAAKSRERVLSEDEIADLAHRLRASRRAGPAGRERSIPVLPFSAQAAVWTLLGTAARIGELSSAEWAHIDLDAGSWHIPETKNGKAHLVHLSPFALRHMQTLRALSTQSRYVLPNRDNSGPLDDQAITKMLTDRQASPDAKQRKGRSADTSALALSGGRWTSHDLRRTAATLMQGLGVDTKVIERCLNHVEEDDMVRVYQRAHRLPERKAAFDALGALLDSLVPAAMTAHLPSE